MTGQTRTHGDVAWTETGAGPAVLFLHGMPGSRTSWAPQFSALSKTHRCIAWDMPGYGDSSHRADLDTPAKMAAFLAGVMTEGMGVTQAHVVGLSLGGMIAMELALARPDLVASLVILDASPKFGLDGGGDAAGFVQSVRMPLDGGTSVRDLCDAILQDLMAPDCADDIRQAALDAMARATPDGLVQAATLIGNHDALDRLAGIAARTLVLVGAQDTATPPAYAQVIAGRIPGARYAEIPGAGHLSNLEAATEVNQRLSGFLPD